MQKQACTEFLQWALPQMKLRWQGFRRVRGQVCKRLARRYTELALPDLAAYRAYLATHPDEWTHLRRLCFITISRFYRDRRVFDQVRRVVLPLLAERSRGELHLWSAGCASGEEPYTLSLIWQVEQQRLHPTLPCRITATDGSPLMLSRAQAAIYPASSLRELPAAWRQQAFEPMGENYSLREAFKQPVTFSQQNIRREMPPGPFDMILCRNMAFMYFAPELQREILARMLPRLRPGAALVIGKHETLPDLAGITGWFPQLGIYRVGV